MKFRGDTKIAITIGQTTWSLRIRSHFGLGSGYHCGYPSLCQPSNEEAFRRPNYRRVLEAPLWAAAPFTSAAIHQRCGILPYMQVRSEVDENAISARFRHLKSPNFSSALGRQRRCRVLVRSGTDGVVGLHRGCAVTAALRGSWGLAMRNVTFL